jgi:ABC transporter substrate binding protein
MAKMLNLFASVLPRPTTVAVLADARSEVHPRMWQALVPVAQALNIKLLKVEVGRPIDLALPAAFETALREKAGAIFVLPDEPQFLSRRAEIVALAAKHRLPAFYGVREAVDDGGLMSYGENLRAAYRNAASYISQVARGVTPGDIPVQQPTRFELVINLKTAKALGISVPQSVLLSADEVVQQIQAKHPMTTRRAVTVALGAGAIEWPLRALGQLPPAKIARVGWLSYLTEPNTVPRNVGCRRRSAIMSTPCPPTSMAWRQPTSAGSRVNASATHSLVACQPLSRVSPAAAAVINDQRPAGDQLIRANALKASSKWLQPTLEVEALNMNRWQIGNVRVSQVVEIGPVPTSPKFFFKDPPEDLVARHQWLKPHLADEQNRLLLSIHCFVIESAGRRIVVDTCVGNDKKRQHPAWNQLNGSFLHDMTESVHPILRTHRLGVGHGRAHRLAAAHALQPASRISRSTVQRATAVPSRLSWRQTLSAP